MNDPKKLFHILSYVQYPFMIVGLYYCYRPILSDFSDTWSDLNKAMVFFGVGIGFASFQDITKTQNKMSRKVFENPRYSRIFLGVIFGQTIIFLLSGAVGIFLSSDQPVRELSYGLMSVGLGMLGMLKTAMEMAEHHNKKAIANLHTSQD